MRKLLALGLLCAFLACLAACSDTPISYNSNSYSVLGKPTLSAKQIDHILCSQQSPACGTGKSLYNLGHKYGIDPAFALAFFKHESTYGRYGVAKSTLSLGNIRCTQGWARCISGYKAYASWEAGYEDWYQLIKYYCDEWGKCTVNTIIPTYAPVADNNNESAYIQSVLQDVANYRQGGR